MATGYLKKEDSNYLLKEDSGKIIIDAGTPPDSASLRYSPIKIIAGHEYRLSFFVRSTIAQTLNIKIEKGDGSTDSLNQNKNIPANITKVFKFEFTAAASDESSRMVITPATELQDLYLDKFVLIDLTRERKEYRLLRIRGTIFPGAFTQTLTLREKTSTESD